MQQQLIKDEIRYEENESENIYFFGNVKLIEKVENLERVKFNITKSNMSDELIFDYENNCIFYNDNRIELPKSEIGLFNFLFKLNIFNHYDEYERFFIIDIITTRIIFIIRARMIDVKVKARIIENTKERNAVARILYNHEKYINTEEKNERAELFEILTSDVNALSSYADSSVIRRLEKVLEYNSKLSRGMLEMEYQIYR